MTERPNHTDVAIIGLAYRFPGDMSDDSGFWAALEQGRNLVTEVSPERWATATLQHDRRAEPGRSITFSAGVLSKIEEFDADFFGISPREAAWMDPQQRLLLELAWEAMENGGCVPSSLAGSDCAVYVGISSLDYGTRGLDDLASLSAHSMTGNTLSIAANRLSYVFDLHGPSLAVDTACSSSLVALHHACRALQSGDAGMALVGGVNLLLHPYPFVGFTKASMLSADGHCRAFDASGKGYVRAEGGAVLLLKPLARAIGDGDDIRAVLLATGVNADGARKTGITIPSAAGQAELMRSVLARSGLSAHDVDFVEAHGTGTAVGDPIEAKAIGEVYGPGRERPLPIGSVKANLGHLESAAGMAGLVKTILALQNRSLPPQLHLEQPNPDIDFVGLNIQPLTEGLDLSGKGEEALVAGVNSFGFGGANAHCLVQEFRGAAEPGAPVDDADAVLPPLFLSARSDAALLALADRYAGFFDGAEARDHYDIAWAAARQRERMERRLAVFALTPAEVRERLAAFSRGEVPEGVVVEDALPGNGGVAFVYSGNGAQWAGMGRRLLDESPRFAEIIDELDRRLDAGFSLVAELQAEDAAARLDDTVVAQPLLFAIQVGVTLLLREQGVVPVAVTGHSVGEVAAAWACGALDLEQAIRVIVTRSQAQGRTRGTGRMAAAALSVDAVAAVVAALGGDIDVVVAGINSPKSVTLSGSLDDLERIRAHLERERVFFRLLDLDYAFHSRRMDPVRDRLLEDLAGLRAGPGDGITFVSTVSGEVLAGGALDASYWWRNVREPVRFADAVTTLSTLGCRVFVEIGPHAILHRYIGETLRSARIDARVLPGLGREADGLARIQEVAMRVHLLDAKPNLDAYFPRRGRHMRLPNYPWQREFHWHPRTSESLLSIERRRVHPLLGWRVPESECTWENTLDPVILPWLAEHRVGGAIVYPAAAYVEMALAAAREWLGGQRLALEEFDIVSPMVLEGERARTLRLRLDPRDGHFAISSRTRLSADEWTLHAAGRVLETGTRTPAPRIDAPAASARHIDGATHYRLAEALGLDYGPVFRGMEEARVDERQLEATITLPHDGGGARFLIHPGSLDACFQSIIGFFSAEVDAGTGVALLPIRVGRLERIRHGAPRRFRARLRRRSARSVLADFELFDPHGNLVAVVSDCRFRAVPLLQRGQDGIARWSIVPCLRPHPAEELATGLPSSRELVEQIHLAMRDRGGQRGAWFKEALPLLEALVLSFAYEACSALAQGDTGLQHLAASSSPYTRWILGLLRQEGLLREQDGRLHLHAASGLPAAADIWRTLERDYPDCLPQLIRLGRVGSTLPRLLGKGFDIRAFVDDLRRSVVTEALYEDDPAYLGTRCAIEATVLDLARRMPAGRRLRVLEITAGASQLPRTLAEVLPEDRLCHVLALTDESLAERQRAEFLPYPSLTVASLDASGWILDADESIPEAFDVVILRHVVHQAVSPGAALNQCRRWLAAGGLLLLAERHPDWSADFVAGVDPAWWHEPTGEGAGVSLPLSSLLPPPVWEEALGQQGFDEVRSFTEPAVDGLAEGAYLLLARRPPGDTVVLQVPEAASWLLLTDASSTDVASALCGRLESRGQSVDVARVVQGRNLAAVDNVVYLNGWDAAPETTATLLAGLPGDLKALAARAGRPPRLWIVARGGALATGMPQSNMPSPAQAALWGFGRVVMNEYPALGCTLIDVAGVPDASAIARRLETELLRPDGATEIVFAEDGRHVLVMREARQDPHAGEGRGGRYRLDFHLPGKIRNLRWLPLPGRSLDDDEVEIRTQAAGLNFRDVMYLMGLLPDEAVEKGFAGASLGLEFSGVVTRTGPRVRDLQPGDRVMGFGSACFASHVVTRADAVTLMPDDWSFEAAATVPTVFFTVYYALRHLADLQEGERVLIHGGAGGIGIAAIQLARHLGAEVFATAGSDEKRDFVRLLGADHVFDSRSLDFDDEVLAATNGEGVDVVLNSLAGEAIRRNLRVLRPFGRFLELGKRDFFENTPIGLRPFKDNISYFGIDADQLLTARAQLASRLFRELMVLFREGVLTPLPHRVFPAERVVDAFRVMQQARHVGKIVVSLAGAQPAPEVPAARRPPLQLAGDSTWLVTGGLSGFGLESVRWLAAHGVRNLALVSRRGMQTPGAQEALARLAELGVHVRVYACDITDMCLVSGMIGEISRVLPPIRGVLHAAAVFDDALLQNLDGGRLGKVIAPKVTGAWNLHQATLDVPLEYFVLYSSITTAIGNPGQAGYVAANAALEGLAEMRRCMGLPGLCIGWGPIGDAGYLSRNQTVRDSLDRRLGRPALAAARALDELGGILAEGRSVTVANLDWSTLARSLPSAGSSRFAVLNRSTKGAGSTGDETDIRVLIDGKTPEEATLIVQQLVVQEIAQILAIGAERIAPSRLLHDLGLDSLMAVELALGLEQRLGIRLPVMLLNESPTAEKVARILVGRLLGGTEQETLSMVDAMVRDVARQHGDSVAAEEVEEIAESVRALAQRGTGLTT